MFRYGYNPVSARPHLGSRSPPRCPRSCNVSDCHLAGIAISLGLSLLLLLLLLAQFAAYNRLFSIVGAQMRPEAGRSHDKARAKKYFSRLTAVADMLGSA